MTVDWIRAGLKRTGKTRSGLAKALGRSPSAVTDLLNGHRRLRADEIAIVSEYLGVEPPRLIGGGPPRPPKAPLVGYVGAGAIAHFYADGQGPFDEVDAPIDAKPSTRRGADPRPFARRAVRQLAGLLRRRPQSAGRQPGRAHVRLRRQRRARADQGARSTARTPDSGTFSPTPSRRSTTSASTGPRWCAKCGRGRGVRSPLIRPFGPPSPAGGRRGATAR